MLPQEKFKVLLNKTFNRMRRKKLVLVLALCVVFSTVFLMSLLIFNLSGVFQAKNVISNANEQAIKIQTSNEKEAELILSDAQEKADSIINNSKTEAEKIIAEAK